MKLAICSDLHLNVAEIEAEDAFRIRCKELAKSNVDALLICGDVGSFYSLQSCIESIQENLNVYFVFGNHDYHECNKLNDRLDMKFRHNPNGRYPYIGDSIMKIMPETYLLGIDNLYSCTASDAFNDRLQLLDFTEVAELKELYESKHINRLYSKFDLFNNELLAKLNRLFIPNNCRRLLIAMHVPPYKEMVPEIWSKYAGFFCNPEIGGFLDKFALAHKDMQIEVYCGHVHCEKQYQRMLNLMVHSLPCKFGFPQISKIIEL